MMTCEREFLNFNESSSAHSTLINPTVLQVLKKYDHLERRTGYFHQRKKVKTKFIDLGMTNFLSDCFYLWDVG